MLRALREAFDGLRWFGREVVGKEEKGYGGGGSNSLLPAWERGLDASLVRAEQIRYAVAEHPTVNRAVRTIASTIGQLSLEVFPTGGDGDGSEALPDHWLPSLLRLPSQTNYGDVFVETAVMFLQSRGECFVFHQGVSRGPGEKASRPRELWLLWPECVQPLPLGVQRIEMIQGWRYSGPEGVLSIPNELMTYMRLPNPHDPVRGLSPLTAVMLEYTGDHRMAVYNRAFYDNAALPAIIFTAKKAWPESDRRAFLAGWELKLRGASRQGLAAALPEHVEATVVKLTQQEMAFLEARRFSREQILSVYGVPPAIAGVFEFANYSNAEQQERFYITKTVAPLARYIGSALTSGLLNRYEPGKRAEFNLQKLFAEVMATEYGKKVETAQRMWQMGVPFAEVNRRLELGIGTDDKPWLESGYLPFSVVPAESLSEAEPTEPVEPTDDAEEDQPEAQRALRPAPGARYLPQPGPGLLLPAKAAGDRDSRWTGLSNLWGPIGRSYHRRLRSWLWGLRGETLRRLEGASRSRSVRRDLDPEDAGSIAFELDGAKVKLVGITRPAWEQAVEAGASALKDETGLQFEFDFLDPRVLGFLADKEVKVVGIAETVRDRIRDEVAEGISKGETVAEIAARIRSAFDVERARSITIARTETAQAFSGGHFEAMRQVGVVFHEWLSSRDGRVRDSHEAVDGEVVAVGERFSNGVQFPGDPSGDASEVINCRCVGIPAEVKP